jgi:hypothetical protein
VSSCCSVTFLRELFLAGGFEPEAAIIERLRRGADRQSTRSEVRRTRSNGTHPSNNENRRISADSRRQISSSRATQTSIPFSLTLTRDSRVRSRYAGEEFLSGPACSPSWTPRSNLRSSWDMRWNTWRRISAVTV